MVNRVVLYHYTSRFLSASDKVRFYYALKGRDGKSGVVKEYKIEFLSKGILLAPFQYSEDIESFLDIWKLPYKKRLMILEHEEEVGE
jgi:hypothetical protein